MSSAPQVYEAINAVQSALSKAGISKDRFNESQRYKFRGIDDVFNALAPLLSEHKLVVIPRILDRQVTERESAKGTLLFYVVVTAEFDFISVTDGSMVTARAFGEGMDSGDKATNKAASSAFKNTIFQAFCVPTEGSGHDSEEDSPEIKRGAGVARAGAPRAGPEPHREPAPTKNNLADLTAEFDLRSIEAESLKELADLFASAQREVKTAAATRECQKSVLVDALGLLTKAKDKAKERLEKKVKDAKATGGDVKLGVHGGEQAAADGKELPR